MERRECVCVGGHWLETSQHSKCKIESFRRGGETRASPCSFLFHVSVADSAAASWTVRRCRPNTRTHVGWREGDKHGCLATWSLWYVVVARLSAWGLKYHFIFCYKTVLVSIYFKSSVWCYKQTVQKMLVFHVTSVKTWRKMSWFKLCCRYRSGRVSSLWSFRFSFCLCFYKLNKSHSAGSNNKQ